jgi:hypothetical protein
MPMQPSGIHRDGLAGAACLTVSAGEDLEFGSKKL